MILINTSYDSNKYKDMENIQRNAISEPIKSVFKLTIKCNIMIILI